MQLRKHLMSFCKLLMLSVAFFLPSAMGLAATGKPNIATCDSTCVRFLTSTYEAQATDAVANQYSAVSCKTIRLRRWNTYNVGSKFAGTFGDGNGLIDARITVRCVPYSGRSPILYVRDFTFDANLNIRDRGTAKAHPDFVNR